MFFVILFLLVIVAGIIIAATQKEVRCPNCTQAHKVFSGTKDFSCNKCGTPVIINGEFAARTDRTNRG